MYAHVQVGADLEKLFDQTFDADVKGTTSNANSISNRSNRIFWNGKEQDWHPDFRIFLISALTNPHFDANVSGRTTIIDASMTLQGLEDQLLHAVVRNLNPTLERSRLEFLATSDGLRKDMDNLDKMLLNELSESEGNLLDNDELMRKLNEMKTSLGNTQNFYIYYYISSAMSLIFSSLFRQGGRKTARGRRC
jgi:dynein heavy chain